MASTNVGVDVSIVASIGPEVVLRLPHVVAAGKKAHALFTTRQTFDFEEVEQ
jgi:hypothetical protein